MRSLAGHVRGLLVLSILALMLHPAGAAPTRQRFDDGPGQTPYAVVSSGTGPTARVEGGALHLLDGHDDQANAAAFTRSAPGCYRRITAVFALRLTPGGDGAAFALLPTSAYGVRGPIPAFSNWEEPNLPGTFAVAFDIHDPPARNPFDANGNIYGRPEREISLHWDGVEVANRLSPVEYRAMKETDPPVRVRVDILFETGGASVSMRVGDQPVYRDFFVPSMLPYEFRAAFGAHAGGGRSGDCSIDDVAVDLAGGTPAVPAPLTVRALERKLLDATHHRQARVILFPTDTGPYGRIVATLALTEPPGGYDPWDRKAAVYVYDDRGERFEILRFITPYRRGYTWKVDVSDYRPLLQGAKKVEVWCETYGPGWLATLDIDYYPGPAERAAYRVANLWAGSVEIGNPQTPAERFFTPRILTRDLDADAVRLRFRVTGHGMSPNSKNAGEFMPLGRTVTVGRRSFAGVLWKTDCYLNPCRPQSGTWKYDRAGWAPGDVVTPWDIDATGAVGRGRSVAVTYRLAPYLNESRNAGFPPSHWVESQVIFYRKASPGTR